MQNYVGQQNIPYNYSTCPPCEIQPAKQQVSVQNNQPVQQSAQTQSQTVPQNTQVPSGQNVSVPNYSGVNIQIFNPSVTPPGATAPVYNVNSPNYGTNPAPGCYCPSYYTTDMNKRKESEDTTTSNTSENTSKKTEKREIVQLTDDYIRTIENYLNSQDKENRLMGAKEVVARLEEDHSRKDDKALNALINKMLQDPSKEVRFLALSAINSRSAAGDSLTAQLLTQMQNSQAGYGQEALEASNALLKMAGQTTEKEFEVKNTTKTETKTQTK